MSMARVGDKVTYILIKQDGRAVFKNRVLSFIYEIAKRFFVLRQHLTNTTKVCGHNSEIVGAIDNEQVEHAKKRR